MTKIFDNIFMPEIFEETFMTGKCRTNIYEDFVNGEIFMTKMFDEQL